MESHEDRGSTSISKQTRRKRMNRLALVGQDSGPYLIFVTNLSHICHKSDKYEVWSGLPNCRGADVLKVAAVVETLIELLTNAAIFFFFFFFLWKYLSSSSQNRKLTIINNGGGLKF